MKNILRHPALTCKRPGWVKINPPQLSSNGFKIAREWQQKAFAALSKQPLIRAAAPPSCGKGVFMCMLASELLRTTNQKVIIAVPQRIISADLKEQMFVLPSTQQEVLWSPHYLNDDDKEVQSNISFTHQFLTESFVEGSLEMKIQNNVCVMTHMTLAMVFEAFPDIFKNVMVFFDEYHHIQYAESECGNITETNSLGQLAKHLLSTYTTNKVGVGLFTATDFRGDKKSIIPEKYLNMFVSYEHPYDKAWSDFAPLESFGVDFVLYQTAGYRKALQTLLGDEIEPCIIYVPNVNSTYSVGHKYDDVTECYKAISGVKTPKLSYEDKDGKKVGKDEAVFTLVKKGKRTIRCINLVDERNRAHKSNVIYKDHISNTRNVDVVLTLGMLKEGASWKWAKNEFIIGARNSFREFVQMVGRLFRPCKESNKTEVMSYYLLPISRSRKDDEYLENFNDYTKALLSSLLLIKVFYPQLIDTQVEEPDTENKGKTRVKRVSFISQVLGNDIERIARLKDDAVEAMIKASHDHDFDINLSKGKVNVTEEQKVILERAVEAVMDDMSITEHRQEVKNELFRWFAVENALLDTVGMNVSDLTYEVVSKSMTHPCKFMLTYTSGMLGEGTFKEYREVVDRYAAQWAEIMELAKKNEDKLKKKLME